MPPSIAFVNLGSSQSDMQTVTHFFSAEAVKAIELHHWMELYGMKAERIYMTRMEGCDPQGLLTIFARRSTKRRIL